MADQIVGNGIDGLDRMLSVREVPWHGKGHILPQTATSQEVIDLVCPWEVKKVPAFVNCGKGPQKIEGQFGIVRSDTNQPLPGVTVGDNYQIVQYAESLRIVDQLTQDPNGPHWETAGTLFGGKRFWGLLAIDGNIEVTENDHIKQFTLVSTSHDGSLKCTFQYTTVRVVCNNTLTLALTEKNATSASYRHSVNVHDKLGEIADTMGILTLAKSKLVKDIEILKNYEPTPDQIMDTLNKLFGDSDKTKTENIRSKVISYIEGPANILANDTETCWGLYNGISEYLQYGSSIKARNGNDASEMRFNSQLLGRNNDLSLKAFNTCMQLAMTA